MTQTHTAPTGNVIHLRSVLARRASASRARGERVAFLSGHTEVTGVITQIFPRSGQAHILCSGPSLWRGVTSLQDCHHLIPIDERGFAQPESGGAA